MKEYKVNKSINQFNENGRQGYWEEHYNVENNQLWYKGYFLNGILHGMNEVYNINGLLMWKGRCNMGVRIGFWLERNLITRETQHVYYL